MEVFSKTTLFLNELLKKLEIQINSKSEIDNKDECKILIGIIAAICNYSGITFEEACKYLEEGFDIANLLKNIGIKNDG
ncbi:MAG: hypothetical protein R3321_04655 [Nitrososphaeraceae archaeon]|nr:hypothetical protein [Nitrososphaeraceae archaeon]